MKIRINRHIKAVLIILILLIIPSLTTLKRQETPKHWFNNLPESYHQISNYINATIGYEERRNTYLLDSNKSSGFYAQSSRVFLNESVNEASFIDSLLKINNREDTADFRMASLLRTMYLDNFTQVINSTLKSQIKSVILNFKYWFTEPGDDTMIMWTENHMILFHTCELLAGQLYPNETFINSGMTGLDHVAHALPLVNRWIEWRARFGFAEWYSNIYYNQDLMALLNLVDFAQDNDTATKAAMLLDILSFSFANNYFKGLFATTHGRTEDQYVMGTSLSYHPYRDSIAEAVWILLGLGYHDHNNNNSLSAVGLATSEKYVPPPILEAIANYTINYNEHRERNSINIADGPLYGFGYDTEDDLMFWWPMSAVFAGEVIEATLNLADTYDLSYKLIFDDEMLVDLIKVIADLYGITLSELCTFIKEAAQGIVMEEANTYTYRTPYYQLSGAQDHQKGMGGYQEHIWQATLDEYAIVYTNSHGGFRGEDFVGGFNPKATFHKNIGVIQYDRYSQSLFLELVYMVLEFEPITQAYFPQWAFDEVLQEGKWTFGRRGNAYVGLYSFEPTYWESNYELRANGRKNAFIVELGSIDEYGSFENFTTSLLSAKINIKHLAVGYDIEYESPTQGLVTVAWDGPMMVDGQQIDLGSYARFDNDFCYQEFNTLKTIIQSGTQTLELDFENATRTYTTI